MQKISTAFLFTVLATAYSSAQSSHFDANLVHNWNYLDRDLELSAEQFLNKNGFKISLHYFQNTAEQNFNWQDKPRATNFAERLGLGITYLRYMPINESNIELYPYFKLTGFKLRYQTQNETSGLFSEPSSWKFYSGIGLQVKSKLYRRLYLSASADAGARWENDRYRQTDLFNGIATGGSVGLAYRIRG
ncbi:MAG: hypothetical protein H7246_15790 [Phycisphaerae bacterium]|nr:hypothetical protein [Saprospiraceae bacterium]